MQTSIACALLVIVFCAAPVAAQPTILLVRHAERADGAPGANTAMATDPDLSDAGRARAESLATALKDANITAIYSTGFKRTQQTAAPLAKALGLTVTIDTSKNALEVVKNVLGVVDRLKTSQGNVLVVGHSDTVPEIIKGLGVTTPVTIGGNDFDNLFLVTLSSPPALLRLHYR